MSVRTSKHKLPSTPSVCLGDTNTPQSRLYTRRPYITSYNTVVKRQLSTTYCRLDGDGRRVARTSRVHLGSSHSVYFLLLRAAAEALEDDIRVCHHVLNSMKNICSILQIIADQNRFIWATGGSLDAYFLDLQQSNGNMLFNPENFTNFSVLRQMENEWVRHKLPSWLVCLPFVCAGGPNRDFPICDAEFRFLVLEEC